MNRLAGHRIRDHTRTVCRKRAPDMSLTQSERIDHDHERFVCCVPPQADIREWGAANYRCSWHRCVMWQHA